MNNSVRLYLLGYKGLLVLQAVLKSYRAQNIKEVIIGKDKGIENDYSLEIEELCAIEKINFKLRSFDKGLDKTISIAIGWRWIIDLNRIPNLIILHDSLLPKYRGFNPLVNALINGENKVGVTALFASELYDTGDIIYQAKTEISYPIKIQTAIELISTCYIDVVIKILQDIMNGSPLPRFKQVEDNASYSLWRDENDYKIDWNDTSERILRLINAVGVPYQGATTFVDNQKIKIIEAETLKDLIIENRCPGKVIFLDKECPVVVCGKGLLKVKIMIDSISNKPFKFKKIRTRFS